MRTRTSNFRSRSAASRNRTKYTYDAWNRLTAIAHAYRSSGTVYAGQTSTTMKYDGKGRRIQKAVTNTGSWDCTFKYYYDNDSCIEERNGSDYVIKENVWGTNYIDELVQTKAESDGTLSSSALSGTDSVFYACQDANYNVLGIVNGSGALIERYEYTPYGQRKTFFSSGSNDGLCYAPTMSSRRASSTAAWGKNEFGHQGLMHDEEIDLVYNRVRHLHPGLGRFAQRDLAIYSDPRQVNTALLVESFSMLIHTPEYRDGLSSYLYEKSSPMTGLDHAGLYYYCSCSATAPRDVSGSPCTTNGLIYKTTGPSNGACASWAGLTNMQMIKLLCKGGCAATCKQEAYFQCLTNSLGTSTLWPIGITTPPTVSRPDPPKPGSITPTLPPGWAIWGTTQSTADDCN